MLFRVSSFNKCLINSCLGTCFVITACITPPADTPPVTPTCISPTPDANPYTSNEITQGVQDIYQKSYTDLGNARQDALFQLGQNMEHWSAQVDVVNDTAHMVRITVTYLDPVLIQYIILNHQINDPGFSPNVVNAPMNATSFNFDLDSRLQQLGARNEMLFIVTITSPFYRAQAYNSTDLTVKLSIDQMTLSGASNIPVKPTHFDHILNENMDITQGPVSGIIGYPIALMLNQDQCTLVIDQWTNTLTLDIPSVILGGASSVQKFWNIPYRSLVMQSDTHPTPTSDPYILNNSITKLDEPPTPSWTPIPGSDNTNWQQLYWEGMGRYIWNLVISESHH
jgi:hypothetical protein